MAKYKESHPCHSNKDWSISTCNQILSFTLRTFLTCIVVETIPWIFGTSEVLPSWNHVGKSTMNVSTGHELNCNPRSPVYLTQHQWNFFLHSSCVWYKWWFWEAAQRLLILFMSPGCAAGLKIGIAYQPGFETSKVGEQIRFTVQFPAIWVRRTPQALKLTKKMCKWWGSKAAQ